MKITWIGHSCFKIESNGFAIVTDPYAPGSVPGLKPVAETAQLVCSSHAHADHAYEEGVTIVNTAENAPEIRKIHSFHDEVKGAKRGANTIYAFDFAGNRAVHLGDIGCDLTEEEIRILKDADVLMIPVGGFYTIDAPQAVDMVSKLKPHIVIPMHYRDEKFHFGYDAIGTVDAFLDTFGENSLIAGCCIDTDEYARAVCTKVIRMIPQNVSQQ